MWRNLLSLNAVLAMWFAGGVAQAQDLPPKIWDIKLGIPISQLPRKPGQAAASISYPVDFAMNSSRVWQTIADGARPCAEALISAFRA